MRNNSGISKALLWSAAGAGLMMFARAHARREYDFRGKVVLITGGSRGLGLVMARQFGDEGAQVAICARDDEELERARMDLSERGVDVYATACDLRDRDQVNAMVNRVNAHFGRVDVLVNNASILAVGPLDEMTLEDFEEAMNSNFWSGVYTTLAVLPQMRGRREGRIANISSIGGRIAVPHLLPYSASKFAMVGFSRGLRSELLNDGVVVTTIVPGLMRTGSPRNASFKGQHKLEYAWFKISDSLPVASMSAEQAARQIIEAVRRGQVELTLTGPAKLAVRFDVLFPEISGDLLAVMNRMLPGPGGIGQATAKGLESESPATSGMLTGMTDRAAERNNQA